MTDPVIVSGAAPQGRSPIVKFGAIGAGALLVLGVAVPKVLGGGGSDADAVESVATAPTPATVVEATEEPTFGQTSVSRDPFAGGRTVDAAPSGATSTPVTSETSESFTPTTELFPAPLSAYGDPGLSPSYLLPVPDAPAPTVVTVPTTLPTSTTTTAAPTTTTTAAPTTTTTAAPTTTTTFAPGLHDLTLSGVFTDGMGRTAARVLVDTEEVIVLAGQTFAGSYQNVSLDPSTGCGAFLAGTTQFSLCERDTVRI